jgi:hypothetical protein
MVRVLKSTGRLEKVDEALVVLARTSAQALDDAVRNLERSYAISACVRSHLTVLLALLGRFGVEPDDGGIGELLAFLQDPEMLLHDAREDVPYPGTDRPPGWDGD